MEIFNYVTEYLPIILTFLAGLIGVRAGIYQIQTEKKIDLIKEQISRLYSPLLGIRYAIRARSELRKEISDAANEAWKRICEIGRNSERWESNKDFQPFEEIIKYDNKQLETELLPRYREMLNIFTENLWLAEPETRVYYKELSKYIDLWDRWLSKSIPPEVMEILNHSENELLLFYEHIEQKMDELKRKLPK